MIDLTSILKAHFRIKPYIHNTPLMFSETLSELAGAEVYTKLENLQKSGAFKIRGAFSKMLTVEQAKCFVTASSGNHGYGVACAARLLNTPCVVVVPSYTPKRKIRAIDSCEAKVIVQGDSWDDSFQLASQICGELQGVMVSPVGDTDVMSGQGTIALEILEKIPSPDYFFCSIGSGSMIAGNGIALKELSPKTKVLGFQTYGADAMYRSLQADKVEVLDKITSTVEGFAIKKVDAKTLTIVKHVVDQIYRFTDQECIDASLFMLEKMNILTELSASICILPFLKKTIEFQTTDKIVITICGGNHDLDRLVSEIKKYGDEPRC